jgi:hypothetical protein
LGDTKFTNVYHQVMQDEGNTKTLQTLKKLGVPTIKEGWAITSFESSIPKFFTKIAK